jgi:hypothetical protein
MFDIEVTSFCMQYVYIAVMRNFSTLDDDFWGFFCNIWILMMVFGMSFVYLYGPGRMPLNYFICIGTSTTQDQETKAKVLIVFLVLDANHLSSKNIFPYSFQSQESYLAFQYFYTLR